MKQQPLTPEQVKTAKKLDATAKKLDKRPDLKKIVAEKKKNLGKDVKK